ncbi:hydantoinase/oxoprolinase family protein [Loigolactobacillus binensis]|uniref:Hydantoinase/oxoprolinase family protein n=1 Tax=Loigolactobacillus binensis TaxID=2559922 RepID=A0ABW3EE66_9LACO|nr:hydantoinase/oxoprolinase family protein [Loigolactobacillus binensis]
MVEQKKRYWLGIDIGGTFTDFALYDSASQQTYDQKILTNTENPANGIIDGLKKYEKMGIDLSKVDYFIHGMTIGLNTLLQRNGSKLALFVSKGFRDILNIQRLRLPVPYNFYSRLPDALIPRRNVFPIKERILADGTEKDKVNFDEVDVAMKQIQLSNLNGVVISFLHSYLEPKHELAVKQYINKYYPDIDVELSSDISNEIGEYERTILACINLYIKNSVQKYLNTLTQKIEQESIATIPLITKSNSGITNVSNAINRPVETLFSGPAAGILGASKIIKNARDLNAITVDIGGTSADISIIEKGNTILTTSNEINGFPINSPAVLLYSIGAGGGSYAWLDNGGMLKVGPSSAGSTPGPAAYGTGMKPTLTDAFIVSNYLNLDSFAGGGIKLDVNRSINAINSIAKKLKIQTKSAASKIVDVVIANMTTELSSILSQRGIDPRDFSLISYGGAGPVLANYLAEELDLKNVILPKSPGTLCAFGALYADYVFNDSAVYFKRLNIIDKSIKNILDKLKINAKKWLIKQNDQRLQQPELKYFISARYVGQTLQIEVPIDTMWVEQTDLFKNKVTTLFNQIYLKTYNHNLPEEDIELTKISVILRGRTPKPNINKTNKNGVWNSENIGKRSITLKNKEISVDIYNRDQLTVGQSISGPAVIDQNDTTILILPLWKGTVDAQLNLILERKL